MLSRFDAVVKDLSQDANQLRIKKLLVYACKRTWESDPIKLEKVDISNLIKELLYLTPTLDQLRTYLISIAKTLSKPAEYILVANAIAQHLGKLYAAHTVLDASIALQDYQQVAQQLQQDPEHLRIKKLLFCACKQTWQNDPAILEQFALVSLVQELHQLTPTPPSLDATLISIVRTLNRSSEYTLLANRINQAFAQLYANPAAQTRLVTQPATAPAMQLPSPVSSSKSTTPTPAKVEVPASRVKPGRVLLPNNLADLRLELMKYANPLRTKLLIYSLLRSTLDHSQESWALLKSHELDDLLRELCHTHRMWTDLQAKLERIARILPEPRQYKAIAEAVLRALKPYYAQAIPIPTPASEPQAAPEDPTALATSHGEPTLVSSAEDTAGSNDPETDPSEERLRQYKDRLAHSNR